MNDQPTTRTTVADSELRALLLEYRRENWNGIQPEATQRQIVEEIIHGDAEGPLRRVEPYLAISSDSRILDLGCGVGSFVVACRRRGLRAFGLEPDRIGQGAKITSVQIASRRLSEPVFVSGVGEELPFPDACFDLVVMNQVIEHVADQAVVIREAARVVREGGAIYVACPNYLRFYEPHYTTNGRLRKLFSELGPDYEALDLHREQFLQKRSGTGFAARSTRLVAKLTRLPFVGPAALWTILKYGSISEGGCEMVVIRKPRAATR